MVKAITSFGRSGLYDWLVQRVSAVILTGYAIFMVIYLLINPDLDYKQWQVLFENTGMRIFSLMTMLALAAHCWIGLWSVSTDYIKPLFIRLIFQIATGVCMFVYSVWGIQLLWGL